MFLQHLLEVIHTVIECYTAAVSQVKWRMRQTETGTECMTVWWLEALLCEWDFYSLCICTMQMCLSRCISCQCVGLPMPSECILYLSGNNIMLYMWLVGSHGIVGNWKSRWTCMSFQEETVTTEIEPNTRATKLISFISFVAPLCFFYFPYSLLIFPLTYSLVSFLSCPLLSCTHSVDL